MTWEVLAGAVLLGLALRRGSSGSGGLPSASATAAGLRVVPSSLAWPLPVLITPAGEYRPVVSDGIGSPRTGGRTHLGVDVMWRRRAARSKSSATATWDLANYRAAPQGTEWHFAPVGVPVRPLADGRVWSTGTSERGGWVLVDHGSYTSYYGHLSAVVVVKGQQVSRESTLGLLGSDPSGGPSSPVHLHLEVTAYPGGSGRGGVKLDVSKRFLTGWSVSWPGLAESPSR